MSSNVSGLAAMVGLNLGNSSGEDALSPELYPSIVQSTPFLLDLFNVHVKDKAEKVDTTLYVYLHKYQRVPWWSSVLSLPFKGIGWAVSLFREKEPEPAGPMKYNSFRLSKEQSEVAKALSDCIVLDVDKKTGVIQLAVTMQDPYISAVLTDTVVHNLQNYITDYRTRKARKDLDFAEKLYNEAKVAYTEKQEAYAAFADANQNIVRQTYMAEQERLQNEMNLAYGVYSQVAQQLQIAKAKVQEVTPVYTVIQPASIPLAPSKPRKVILLIGFIFLGGVGSIGWILFLKDFAKMWKKKTIK
jgi:capsular polysaccharide biosynthesis protein